MLHYIGYEPIASPLFFSFDVTAPFQTLYTMRLVAKVYNRDFIDSDIDKFMIFGNGNTKKLYELVDLSITEN